MVNCVSQQRQKTEILQKTIAELRQQLDSFQQNSSSEISKMQADLDSAIADRFFHFCVQNVWL